jgi:hypothetical protein
VEETTSELLAIIQSLFSSLFYGIPTMGGSSSFMSGSQIPNTLLNRMPAQAGNQHREFLGRVGGQNNPPRQLIEGTLTTLKNRLGS